MPDPEDAPPQPPTDFVAWMSAEMPEVAASGRRIQRRHLRLAATRPTRWRSVRRLRSTARGRGRDWGRWLVAGMVLVLAGWGVVAIVHPFGLGLPASGGPPPAAAPVTSAPVPSEAPAQSPAQSPDQELFPAHVTFAGHTADRVAMVTDAGCRPGPGVPASLAGVVLDAGDCRAIRVAEYVDLTAGARMVVATVEMADPTTAAIMPLVISEHLIGPALLTKPPAQTIFAGVAGCSATVGLVGSAAHVAGTQAGYQALADETARLMRRLAEPGCNIAPN